MPPYSSQQREQPFDPVERSIMPPGYRSVEDVRHDSLSFRDDLGPLPEIRKYKARVDEETK